MKLLGEEILITTGRQQQGAHSCPNRFSHAAGHYAIGRGSSFVYNESPLGNLRPFMIGDGMGNDNEGKKLGGIAAWARKLLVKKAPDAPFSDGKKLMFLAERGDWQGLGKAWLRLRDARGSSLDDARNACFQWMARSQSAPPSAFIAALEGGADLCAGFSPEAEARKEDRRRGSKTPYAQFLFEEDCPAILLAKRLAMAGAWPELARVASWMGSDPARRARWEELGRAAPLGAIVAHAAALRMARGHEEWPLAAQCLEELGASGITFNTPLFSGASALLAACGEIASDDYFTKAFRWDSEANALAPRSSAAPAIDSADSTRAAGGKQWSAMTYNRILSFAADKVRKERDEVALSTTHMPLATLLLDLGADIEGSRGGEARSPFLAAAMAGDARLVELLAARGADIHASWKGDFAPHLATDFAGSAWKPSEDVNETLTALARLGLDLTRKDQRGFTPKQRYCASRLVLSVDRSSPDRILALAIGRTKFEEGCHNDFDGLLASIESESIAAALPPRPDCPPLKAPRL